MSYSHCNEGAICIISDSNAALVGIETIHAALQAQEERKSLAWTGLTDDSSAEAMHPHTNPLMCPGRVWEFMPTCHHTQNCTQTACYPSASKAPGTDMVLQQLMMQPNARAARCCFHPCNPCACVHSLLPPMHPCPLRWCNSLEHSNRRELSCSQPACCVLGMTGNTSLRKVDCSREASRQHAATAMPAIPMHIRQPMRAGAVVQRVEQHLWNSSPGMAEHHPQHLTVSAAASARIV